MKYQIRLESFTGPLDLLIHLIEKEEIDVYDIPVAKITEEYISYLQTIEELDLDNMSEFLLMAINLLQIKAALLLPDPVSENSETEEKSGQAQDMKQELVERLLEYRKFKKAAQTFSQWESLQKKVYHRSQEESIEEERELELSEVSLEKLLSRLQKILQKVVKEELTQVVVLEEFTIEQRMEGIMDLLKSNKGPIKFDDFFLQDKNKLAVITSFLALLELVRLKKIKIRQDSSFTPIYVTTWRRGWEEGLEGKSDG